MVTLADAADAGHPWVLWVLGGLAAWLVLGLVLAVVIGTGIRLADRRSPAPAASILTTADVPSEAPARAAAVRRRAIPLPPIGVALAGLAVALETVGYVVRLNGETGTSARLLSMDAPNSIPRLFVATTFAASALLAVAGASRLPGRRTWWVAVGLVAGGIAAVKAGGTLHADALGALESAYGSRVAQLISVAAAAAVVAGLWFLSRDERRDRRRILSVLAVYAGAAVGLSALSEVAASTYGNASSWAAAATYVEESGEALAGVSFLIAVLIGVAPRLALPVTWSLRRTVDAQTLDLQQPVTARQVGDRPANG